MAFPHHRALGPPVDASPDTSYHGQAAHLDANRRLLLRADGPTEDRRLAVETGLVPFGPEATTDGGHGGDQVPGRPRPGTAGHGTTTPEQDRFVWRLPADPSRLGLLRQRVRDFLVTHDVGEADLFDLTVVVSEAAANAIEHPVAPTEPVISVEVTVEERSVVVTVRDSGQWRDPSASTLRGRGLSLIGALGDLSVTHTATGTEVTLHRRLTG